MLQASLKIFLSISIIVTIINLKSVSAGFGGCLGKVGLYPAWTHWSECSVTCGKGKRVRECRCFDDIDKDIKEEGEGGCTTSTVELEVMDKEICHLKDCPGDKDDDNLDSIIIIIVVILILPLLKLFG